MASEKVLAFVENVKELTVLELAELVKALEEEFGVGSSVLTHKKEQQIKIAGEFKPTVDCLCATRRGFVAVYIEKVRSAECT